jgi:hypothetical protein
VHILTAVEPYAFCSGRCGFTNFTSSLWATAFTGAGAGAGFVDASRTRARQRSTPLASAVGCLLPSACSLALWLAAAAKETTVTAGSGRAAQVCNCAAGQLAVAGAFAVCLSVVYILAY